jgi:hypothetical protein
MSIHQNFGIPSLSSSPYEAGPINPLHTSNGQGQKLLINTKNLERFTIRGKKSSNLKKTLQRSVNYIQKNSISNEKLIFNIY